MWDGKGTIQFKHLMASEKIRSVRHPPAPNLPLFVVVVLIIGNINTTFKSNSVLKITDARRLSHKLDCPALSVLFYWSEFLTN